MKICMLFEGSYPHITGGVSTWAQILIENLPGYEFSLYTIGADQKYRGKFKYNLPDNVTEVHEVFFDQILEKKGRYGKKYLLSDEVKKNLEHLISGEEINWAVIFELIKKRRITNAFDFFMSIEFFDILKEAYINKFRVVPFTDFFWTIRSMLLPLFYIFELGIPKADLYHSASNGYAGFVGALGKSIHGSPLLLTEHGIYQREREEEIIKSTWTKGIFKDLWINFFKSICGVVYDYSDSVYTLYEKNKEIEIDFGCDEGKIGIIPNGIAVDGYLNLPGKDEEGLAINMGTITKVAPIKDLKTMIQSFNIVKKEIKNANLFIMGPTDEDKDYFKECKQLVERLKVKDVSFTGRVNIKEELGKMDIMLLTSISEGQPFVILEGFAAGKPYVSTDVGGCKELLFGAGDGFGQAGLLAPMMNVNKIAAAIITLCRDKELRKTFGENGKKRVQNLFTDEKCIESYKKVYEGFN